MYHVGLIGCGYMGQSHLEDIYMKDYINLVGVCDLNLDRAKMIAKRYHAECYCDDPMKLIEDKNIQIIIIATYPSSHLNLLRACIEHKKHVICEKPITTNLEDGKEFVRLVKDHPEQKVLVGHILRHNDTYKTVAELIQNDVIGKPIIMRMIQNHNTKQWGKYQSLIEETSPIIDCGVHYIDVMRWFTGEEIVNVTGVGVKTESSIPDDKYNYGLLSATLSGGSAGFYEVCWSHTIATDNTKEFIGPKGRIKIIYQKDRETHKENGNLIQVFKYPENETEMINVPYSEKPTGAQLDYLIEMIETNCPASPSIEEVLKSFEVVCEADKIIKKNMGI